MYTNKNRNKRKNRAIILFMTFILILFMSACSNKNEKEIEEEVAIVENNTDEDKDVIDEEIDNEEVDTENDSEMEEDHQEIEDEIQEKSNPEEGIYVGKVDILTLAEVKERYPDIYVEEGTLDEQGILLIFDEPTIVYASDVDHKEPPFPSYEVREFCIIDDIDKYEEYDGETIKIKADHFYLGSDRIGFRGFINTYQPMILDDQSNDISSVETYTEDELVKMSLIYFESNYTDRPKPSAISYGVEDDILTIQLGENNPQTFATMDWYYIDINTGVGTNFDGDIIDLTPYGE